MLLKGNEDAVFIEQKRMAGALGNKEKKVYRRYVMVYGVSMAFLFW